MDGSTLPQDRSRSPLDDLVKQSLDSSSLAPLVDNHMPPKAAPLLQGTLELIVLQFLRAEPTNGYDLTLRIQATSNDVLNINAGSLYPALYRLEARGLITFEWQATENGRKAKVYSLTRAGQKELVEQRESWARFSGALAAILKVT